MAAALERAADRAGRGWVQARVSAGAAACSRTATKPGPGTDTWAGF